MREAYPLLNEEDHESIRRFLQALIEAEDKPMEEFSVIAEEEAKKLSPKQKLYVRMALKR